MTTACVPAALSVCDPGPVFWQLCQCVIPVPCSSSSGDDHSLPRLILANLQRLDRLTDPAAVSQRMLELLLGAPPEVLSRRLARGSKQLHERTERVAINIFVVHTCIMIAKPKRNIVDSYFCVIFVHPDLTRKRLGFIHILPPNSEL